MSNEEIRQRIAQAAHCWFNDTFDSEMLQQMQKHGIIAQVEGFTAACNATLAAEMESALGVEED